MAPIAQKSMPPPSGGEATREYLFDMIAQLARLARRTGEAQVAVHLEAILAARRLALEKRAPSGLSR